MNDTLQICSRLIVIVFVSATLPSCVLFPKPKKPPDLQSVGKISELDSKFVRVNGRLPLIESAFPLKPTKHSGTDGAFTPVVTDFLLIENDAK